MYLKHWFFFCSKVCLAFSELHYFSMQRLQSQTRSCTANTAQMLSSFLKINFYTRWCRAAWASIVPTDVIPQGWDPNRPSQKMRKQWPCVVSVAKQLLDCFTGFTRRNFFQMDQTQEVFLRTRRLKLLQLALAPCWLCHSIYQRVESYCCWRDWRNPTWLTRKGHC